MKHEFQKNPEKILEPVRRTFRLQEKPQILPRVLLNFEFHNFFFFGVHHFGPPV
jgi:hypothetical protein